MNTNIIVKQGFAYLKDYEFYLVTNQDIHLIENNELNAELLPIPLSKKHFMMCGFEKCHDNFGKGDYFKLIDTNIWWSENMKAYYYTCRRFRYYMRYFHEFQYFLETYLRFEIIDYTEISRYINNHYRDPDGRLSLRLYYISIGMNPGSCFTYRFETENEHF